MSALEDLFQEEARILAPAYAAYRQSPSAAAGQRYDAAARAWLDRAGRELYKRQLTDPFFVPLSQRFDVVVRSVNEVAARGHSATVTTLPFSERLKSELGLHDITQGAKEGFGVLVLVAAVLLILYAVN